MTESTAQKTNSKILLCINDARREFQEDGKLRNLPFWVYHVNCRTNISNFATGNNVQKQEDHLIVKVWRRYNDFQWLREKLIKTYGGHIVPPLPEKDFFGTLDKVADLVSGADAEDWRSNDFIALRLSALNKFVRALSYSSVAETDILKNFICMYSHTEWNAYKETIDKKLKVEMMALKMETTKIGSMKTAMLGKFRGALGKSSTPTSDTNGLDPRILRIQAQSVEFEANLCKMYMATIQIFTRGRSRLKAEDVVYDGDGGHAKEVIPLWLLSVGHKVCSVEGQIGTVRHVLPQKEISTPLIGIEWSEAIGNCDGTSPDGTQYFKTEPTFASYVQSEVVFYPRNGISDPVILAAREASSQIDSYLLPYGNRAQKLLSDLVDMTYFWRMYALALIEVIGNLEELQKTRNQLLEAIQKESRPDRLQDLRTRLENVTKTIKENSNTFCGQFTNHFQPQHRRSMKKILELYVAVQREICAMSMTWTAKIAPVMSLLQIEQTEQVEAV